MSAISVTPDSAFFPSSKAEKAPAASALEKKEKKKTTRVQIDLADNAMERLNFLKTYFEAGSVSEVIRNSLRLYEDMAKERRTGKEFLIKDPSGVISPYKAFVEP